MRGLHCVRRTVLATLCLLVLPRIVFAAEAPAEDEEADNLEEEAFGTRGVVRTRAETVAFDAKERSLELAGDVRVDFPPFHLRSQRIRLARTKWGIEADGEGTLAFCPCLGTPVTIAFEKAIVAPPGELILKAPKLEIYGVPVMYLPWFWMRSDEKVGLLPPDLAYRGQDGFYAGGGVHLPWKDRGTRHTLDLRGGAYLKGGFITDVRLRDPNATTKIRFDHLPGSKAPALADAANADSGLLVDARGRLGRDDHAVAWDVDVLRGRRGVAATTDLDTAAKPWDRAAASAALTVGPLVVASGFRALTRRGGDLSAVDAAGPFAAVRTSGAASSNVSYDATVEGGALRLQAIDPQSVSYARVEFGALAATNLGPFAASFSTRGAGNVAAEAHRSGSDRAGAARLRLSVPMARSFGEGDPIVANDPLVHVLEPFAEAAVLHTSGDAILGTLPGRGLAAVRGTAPVTSVGFASTLGRWALRDAFDIAAAYGVAYTEDAPRSVMRTRAGASTEWFGANVESGHLVAQGDARGGTSVVARARVGRREGLRLAANVATRGGIDPILARALTEASLEAPAAFLANHGTTGGAAIVVPWSHAVTTSIGADGDATARELVAARAGLELRDRCGCITLHANGSHRIGRSGVDVWLALDFATDR